MRSKRDAALTIIVVLLTVAAFIVFTAGSREIFGPDAQALDPPIVTTLTRQAETEEAAGAMNRDQADWFDQCPFDPYTPTPQPVQAPYTPIPSPTCRPTHTPIVISTFTPYPTNTPYPDQPDPHLPTPTPTHTPIPPTRTPTATTISPVSPLLIP